MKFVFFLLLFNSFYTFFAQTLDQQIYTQYFQANFLYEPAFIKDDKIKAITTTRTCYVADTLQSVAIIKVYTFREDGKPTEMREIDWKFSDTITTQFNYDTLGNLIKIRKHTFVDYANAGTKELSVQLFQYDKLNRLVKYFIFQNDGQKLALQRSDSLAYSSDNKKITIYYGNLNSNSFYENPIIAYPLQSYKYEIVSKAKEEENKSNCLHVTDKSIRFSILFDVQRMIDRHILQKFEANGLSCLPKELNSILFPSDRLSFNNVNQFFFLGNGLNESTFNFLDLNKDMRIENDTVNFYLDKKSNSIIILLSYFYSYPVSMIRDEANKKVLRYNYVNKTLEVDSRSIFHDNYLHTDYIDKEYYEFYPNNILKRVTRNSKSTLVNDYKINPLESKVLHLIDEIKVMENTLITYW